MEPVATPTPFERIKSDLESSDLNRRKSAMDDLVKAYYVLIQRHIHEIFFGQIRDDVETLDIAQLVFIKACRWIEEGKIILTTEAKLLALLRQMAYQILVDHSRGRKRRGTRTGLKDGGEPGEGGIELMGSDPTASKQLQEEERQEALRQLNSAVRAQLQPDEWYLFDLISNQGLEVEAVAASLSDETRIVTAGAVRMRLLRIRQKLAGRIKNMEHLLDKPFES